MHYHVHIIENYPKGVFPALRTRRPDTRLFKHLFFHIVADRGDIRGGIRIAYNEIIRDCRADLP